MFPELRHKGVQHQFSVIDHYPLAVAVSVIVVRLAASRLKHLLPHAVGDCRYLRGERPSHMTNFPVEAISMPERSMTEIPDPFLSCIPSITKGLCLDCSASALINSVLNYVERHNRPEL